MNLEQRAETTLSQQQHLTLEIRQGVALLGFGAQDLADYVIKCAEDNPFFDADNFWDDADSSEGGFQAGCSADELFERQERSGQMGSGDARPVTTQSDRALENYAVEGETLEAHIERQIRMLDQPERMRQTELWIAGNLDEDGYLRLSEDEINEACPGGIASFNQALPVVQSLDPCGVGARSLEECILIQLRAHDVLDATSAEFVKHHLWSLARKSLAAIAQDMKANERELERVLAQVRSCNPRPGSLFSKSAQPVWPEVVVEWNESSERFDVRLQDILLTRLTIDPKFETLARNVEEKKTRFYLDQKRREANALINGIHQRKQTIYLVARSIVDSEQEFFLRGYDYLVPLTMAETAERAGVAESTVSRIANSSYLQSPRGVYSLRFFFHSGLQGDAGDVSSRGVKRRMQHIIGAEDPAHPLSDRAIAEMIAAEGLPISRRTVNKYRIELGIPSCSVRKKSR